MPTIKRLQTVRALLIAVLAIGALASATNRVSAADDPKEAAKQRLALLASIERQGMVQWGKRQEIDKRASALQLKLNTVNANLAAVAREGAGIESAMTQLQQAIQNLQTQRLINQNNPTAVASIQQSIQQDTADGRALEVRRNELLANRTGLGVLAQGIIDQLSKERASLDALNAENDQLRREWLTLLDPFGKLSRGEHETAIAVFSEWIVRDGQNPGAFLARGFAYRRLGKFELALADFKRAAELGGLMDSTALAAFGTVEYAMGKRSEGMANLGRAVKADKTNSMIFLLRGETHLSGGSVTTAIADFKLAIQLNGREPAALQHLALVLAASDKASIRNGKKALSTALAACELTKWEDWQSLDVLAAAYAETGDFDAAVKWSKKAAELALDENRDQCLKRSALYATQTPLRIEWKKDQ